MKLDYNYHSHTYRCGHASGTDEELTLTAIGLGIKRLGFSDHVFIPNRTQDGIRGRYEQLEEYLSSIDNLKEKYKGSVDIICGFECEYSKEVEPYYRSLLDNKIVDYLIQGQHCHVYEDKIVWYGAFKRQKRLKLMMNDLLSGMASGLFKYVAHPDMICCHFQRYCKSVEKFTRMICEQSLKYDIPLEINMGRTRGYNLRPHKDLSYPYEPFWKIVGEYGCKVVIGYDAHSIRDYQVTDLSIAEKIIKKYKLNYQPDFTICENK